MMKTRKLLCMILVAATISCFSSIPSFAFSATASNALTATSSNALPMEEYLQFDEFDILERPALLMSSDDVVNTVDLSKCRLQLGYYDMSGVLKFKNVNFNSSGYASMSLPSDFASSRYIGFVIMSDALPPAGKYNMSCHFGSNTGGFTYSRCYVNSRKQVGNADTQLSGKDVSFSQSSGDVYVNTTIDINSGLESVGVLMYLTDLVLPYGGYLSVQFTKLSPGASTDVGTAGGSYTPEDAASDTALNTSKMADTLEEIAQTISNQLEALWNQMFNLMHVPQLANDDKNTGLITGAIEEQVEADRQNTEDIIAAEESNTTTIINNNNENTEKITNGYDNSALNAENDKQMCIRDRLISFWMSYPGSLDIPTMNRIRILVIGICLCLVLISCLLVRVTSTLMGPLCCTFGPEFISV